MYLFQNSLNIPFRNKCWKKKTNTLSLSNFNFMFDPIWLMCLNILHRSLSHHSMTKLPHERGASRGKTSHWEILNSLSLLLYIDTSTFWKWKSIYSIFPKSPTTAPPNFCHVLIRGGGKIDWASFFVQLSYLLFRADKSW